jgi:TolA-binding protein
MPRRKAGLLICAGHAFLVGAFFGSVRPRNRSTLFLLIRLLTLPRVTGVTGTRGFAVDLAPIQTYIQAQGVAMKDIHEVLRRKQAQHAQLGKQIEMLQQAAEKLREVAPLLADNENEDDSAVLAEVDEENSGAMAAKAGAQSSTAAKPGRGTTPRWP